MRWQLDPDFALQTRVVFGRTGIVLWTAACAAAIVSAATASRQSEFAFLFLTPGLALLFFALPYSAVQVLALERDGRFDQHRLAGRPPLALGTAVLAGASWPLWLAAATLSICGVRLGARVPIADAGALLSAGIALALAILAVPPAAGEAWLLRVGLGILALLAVGLTQFKVDDTRPFDAYATAVLLTGALTSAILLPRAMRRLYRPQRAAGGMPSTILRSVLDMGRTRVPEMARALLASGAGAAASVGIAAICVIVLSLWSEWLTVHDVDNGATVTATFLFAPLLIAAYNVTTAVARERRSGALDRILLSERPWSIAWQLAAGYALPYAAISVVIPPTVLALGWRISPALLLAWPALALMLIGAALAEAVRARPLGLYIGAVLYGLMDPRPFTAAVLLSGCWVPWVWLVRSVGRSRGMPLTGVTAALAAFWVGAAAALLAAQVSKPMLIVAGFAALGAGLFVPDRAPGYAPGTRAICALAAALGAGVVEYAAVSGMVTHWSGGVWVHWLFLRPDSWRTVVAITAGLYAAGGILIGWLTHNLFGRKPLDSRMLRAVPLLIGYFLLPDVFSIPGGTRLWNFVVTNHWSPYFFIELLVLAGVAAAVVALMALEWRRLGLREHRS